MKKIFKYVYGIGILSIPVSFVVLILSSCIKDEVDDRCGFYLEFVYHYNMEYTDSFEKSVPVVDVYVFNSEGVFMFSERSPRQELEKEKFMLIGEKLEYGTYKVLTVGGLSDKFTVTDGRAGSFQPGVSRIEDVQLALIRDSEIVSHEFEALWYGRPITIDYKKSYEIYTVNLVKQTNRFNLVLVRQLKPGETEPGPNTDFSYDIVTPEGAVYGHDNRPLVDAEVTYKPYLLINKASEEGFSVGYSNTCRLFDNDRYKFVLRNKNTFKILWEYDLMKLLKQIKPTRPDGSILPMDEYLDRQSEWNIIVLHQGGGTDEDFDAFIAVRVIINDWLVWDRDIPIS